MIRSIVRPTCILVSTGVLLAQQINYGEKPSAADLKWSQIAKNTRRMNVTMELDRKVYFPHEPMIITVTVSNPTTTALEVIEPLSRASGAIVVEEEDGFGLAGDLPASPFQVAWASGATTRTIAAGEQIKMSITTSETLLPWTSTLSYSDDAGLYHLVYLYGGTARVEFFIKYPRIIKCSFEEEPRIFEWEEVAPGGKGKTGRRIPYKKHVGGCLLDFDGRYIVAISPVSQNSAYYAPDKSGEFNRANAAYFPGLRRVVESDEPLEDFVMTPQLDGKLVVSYTTRKDKIKHSVRLKSNREVDSQ